MDLKAKSGEKAHFWGREEHRECGLAKEVEVWSQRCIENRTNTDRWVPALWTSSKHSVRE